LKFEFQLSIFLQIFLSSEMPRLVLSPTQAIGTNRYSRSLPGAKRPGHETHISSPLSSEGKNE